MTDQPDNEVEDPTTSTVYDPPAARLRLIWEALRRQGFTKAQADALTNECVAYEFYGSA